MKLNTYALYGSAVERQAKQVAACKTRERNLAKGGKGDVSQIVRICQSVFFEMPPRCGQLVRHQVAGAEAAVGLGAVADGGGGLRVDGGEPAAPAKGEPPLALGWRRG